MTIANKPARPGLASSRIVQRVQRDDRIRRPLPRHLVPAVISSPAEGPMRRDGALTRFLDLTRPA